MKKSDGTCTLELEFVANTLQVMLDASQYKYNELAQYEAYLKEDGLFTRGQIKQASEERLELVYDLGVHAKSLEDWAKSTDMMKRLELARKLSRLESVVDDARQAFIHPENIFLVTGDMQIAHRGVVGFVSPDKSESTLFLTKYKALVVHVLNPSYDYEALVKGSARVKTAIMKKIMDATNVVEVETILDDEYNALYRQHQATKKSVKKSQFSLFRFLTFTFGATLILVGIWLGILLESTLPRYERIMEAQAAYMVNNFSEAVGIMREDEPDTLPSSVLYMLASSYVQLEILTADQRQNILNNLSPSSPEQELTYWIFIGRGQFEYGLDIAYSLGDRHLRLHAYALLYEMVYADMEMPGAEKQSLLASYRQEIENLVAALEGREAVNLSNQTIIEPEIGEYDETEEEGDGYEAE